MFKYLKNPFSMKDEGRERYLERLEAAERGEIPLPEPEYPWRHVRIPGTRCVTNITFIPHVAKFPDENGVMRHFSFPDTDHILEYAPTGKLIAVYTRGGESYQKYKDRKDILVSENFEHVAKMIHHQPDKYKIYDVAIVDSAE